MSSPAVPIHGNYHGYYLKRPSVNDPRLELLPPGTFAGKRVLDVGCNEGWVSCEIAQSHDALKVVGVDIDNALVRAAWRRRRATRKRKRVEPVGEPDYFPASCAHTLGPLPIPNSSPLLFPHNPIPEDENGYDVVLAFSITKWIHLNGGDDALPTVLSPGGHFVVEPQAWDTYRKAKRMDKRLRDTAQGLELRPDDFPRMLADLGFGQPLHLGSVGEGGGSCLFYQRTVLNAISGFHRPVDVYTKT
ncbi:Bicoid-interacting protein 3-domain-containing protein [Mycena rebaudengoi]|nr:Bicoid-interacting protein 3-domain-containing protein [Mycena rebaudengoi]